MRILKIIPIKNPKRLKGGSLVITLVIAFVLSILCSSLIMLSYYDRQYDKSAEIDANLRRNLESASALVLNDTVVYTHSQTDSLDLFQGGHDSVAITKAGWGAFQLAEVNAFYGRFTASRIFLYGSSLQESMNSCLYVPDRQRSVSLVGNTRLIGNAYLSGADLTTGYINQRGFELDKLIEGEIKRSANQLPALNEGFLDHVKNLLKSCADTLISKHTQPYINPDSLSVSFGDNEQSFFAGGMSTLRDCKLSGRIMIFSNGLLEIESTARLDDIIIVAPAIKFKKGFQGRLQAFASDSLIIEDDCIFNYPSSIMLVKGADETVQNKLSIGENCRLSGLVLSVCKPGDRNRSYVEVKKNSIVTGIIYTMGYLDLRGDVEGSVMTDFFIHRTPVTIYENYLVDVSIDRSKLSRFFLSPSIFKGSSAKGIIKWVD